VDIERFGDLTINRLKTLKRAMFGRANLDLLKALVLKAA
jgi:transposase